ncbi:MAG: phosphate/phosphite/phosphonate ABC transporter substrate-binding protein [Nitrospirae bacterium]|nr:MAG: phosphate/phosphite/phosphonate ABC transporter substrate-binding protein [Nitrospirota bacterium]
MKFILNFILLFFVLLKPLEVFAEEEILLGLIPEQNIFKQMDRYKPLAAYLSEKAGVNVRLTILSRYGDIVERFISRGLDGAFFDSLTGMMAITRLGVEPAARHTNPDGKATVRSYIFVRADSKINSVKDMKGKKVAFVDRATATGYLFAIAFLRENGVSDIDRYFNEYYFTGSHDSAIYAVLDNRADIGSAQDTIFNMLASRDITIKKELRVIAQSEELPETTLCLRKGIPSQIKKRLTGILLGMNEDPAGREILKKFGALKFVEAEVKDFNPVFSLARRAQINIREYKGTR